MSTRKSIHRMTMFVPSTTKFPFVHDPTPPLSGSSRLQVVDTTGAGDAFSAGFLHVWKATGGGAGGVRRAAGGDVQAALRWGCALGTTVVTRVGASPRLSVEDDIRPNLV